MPMAIWPPTPRFVALGLAMTLVGTWLPARAAEGATRIPDRAMVERLVRVEEGVKALRQEMVVRFEAVDKRFEAVDKRFDDLNRRLDVVMWMLGVFVTAAMVILGFVVRMQWQMSRRQARMEMALETQRDEIVFLKGLIEKLLPPRGAL